jgi:DNA-binding PadR family transcriptional regulator
MLHSTELYAGWKAMVTWFPKWAMRNGGPARRVYSLTPAGERHLQEWRQVLANLGHALSRFAHQAGQGFR